VFNGFFYINFSLLQWLAEEGAYTWSVTGSQAFGHERLIQLNSMTVGTERIINYMIHDIRQYYNLAFHYLVLVRKVIMIFWFSSTQNSLA
jgi:hypothetical protein